MFCHCSSWFQVQATKLGICAEWFVFGSTCLHESSKLIDETGSLIVGWKGPHPVPGARSMVHNLHILSRSTYREYILRANQRVTFSQCL